MECREYSLYSKSRKVVRCGLHMNSPRVIKLVRDVVTAKVSKNVAALSDIHVVQTPVQEVLFFKPGLPSSIADLWGY